MKKTKGTASKKAAAPKKARVAVPARKKVVTVVAQTISHLVLAPQDQEGLMEFKGPLPLPPDLY